MASLGMGGAFALTNAKIDEVITKTSAGNYALGYTKDGTFYVKYVGRSDSCVRSRLKQHVGKHPQFKFCYAGSPKAAFEKECTNFHDFGGTSKLENDIHPDRPENANWKCPGCKCFE